MLKENKKLKADKTKEEKARIRKLVDLAYKHDPRIILEEKRINDEKEKIRIERELHREMIKKEAEDRNKRLQEEYEEKKKREIEEKAQLLKNKLSEFLNLIKDVLLIELSKDEIFKIELNANADNLICIINEINNEKEDKIKVYKTLSSKFFGLKFADDTKESSVWNKEEVFNLQQAVS